MRPIRSNIEVLSKSELLLIHENALRILDEIGMRVPNEALLSMCGKRGCIAKEGQRLSFPRRVMEEFIEAMRTQGNAVPAGEAQKLYGRISTQVHLVNPMNNTRRYGLREDNIRGFRLMEKLKYIPASGAVVVPSDVPAEIADAVAVADMYTYSTKPGDAYTFTPAGAQAVWRMNDLLGRKSNYLLESISPLSFKPDTLDMALFFAGKGGALRIAPMAMGAATAPVTVAGTLTLETAEILGSSFLVHVMTGQFPAFEASCHSADPRTMLCSFGAPNQAFFAAAAGQLARFYGMAGGSNAALTDALSPDFQGGFEKGVTAAFAGLSGLRFIGCQGITGADQGFSFEQLVIDNEWLGYLNYIIEGFDVTEETIGFDVIKDAGIAGNFLGEEHTVEHMRGSFWMSEIFGRCDWDNWRRGGGRTILERAHAFVEQTTEGYRGMESVLDEATRKELERIIDKAREGKR